LLAGGSTHAEWRSPGLIGQVRVFDLNSLGADADAVLVAEAITQNAEADCAAMGGAWQAGVRTDVSATLARRGFTCRKGIAAAEETVAYQAEGNVYVFSMRSNGRETAPVQQFAQRLASELAAR